MIIQLLFMLIPWTWACLPPYWMILNRVADNHGRGVYVIEQDVTYQTETDTQTIRETWTILDESRMKVRFQGLGQLKTSIHGTYIYAGALKSFMDTTGVKSTRVGDDWSESFFYFRNPKTMRSRLVALKMAPQESLRDRPPLKSTGSPECIDEPFLRLVRQNGIINWTVAQNFGGENPQVWFEQDQFVISRLRLPSKTVVDAEDYEKYKTEGRLEPDFYFPKTRTYKWNNSTVKVQVRSVKSLGNARNLDLGTLAKTEPSEFLGSDALKDFYSRFR